MAGPIQGYQFDGFPLGVPAVSVGASRQGEGRNADPPEEMPARNDTHACKWGGDLKRARNPTLLIPWISNGHEIPPCWSRGVGGGGEAPGNANSPGENLPPMPQPDTPCQV